MLCKCFFLVVDAVKAKYKKIIKGGARDVAVFYECIGAGLETADSVTTN